VCRQASVELPAEPSAAPGARTYVSDLCERWQLDDICDDLVLPVSELVTNSILHARTPVTVTVSLTKEFVEVAVRDADPRPPVVRPVRADLGGDIDTIAARLTELPHDLRDPRLHVGEAGSIAAGRGLQIVDAVADEWGVAELAVGKDVWFRIRCPESWEPPAPCPCSEADGVITAGGLRVVPQPEPAS